MTSKPTSRRRAAASSRLSQQVAPVTVKPTLSKVAAGLVGAGGVIGG